MQMHADLNESQCELHISVTPEIIFLKPAENNSTRNKNKIV